MTDINLCPFLRIAVVLILGIIVGDAIAAPVLSWVVVTLLSVVITFAVYRSSILQSLMVMLSTFLFGCWLITVEESSGNVSLPIGEQEYRAVIVSQPVVHGKVMMMDMIITDGAMKGRKVKASILRDTISNRQDILNIGYGVDFYAQLEEPEDFHTGSKFNYRRWLQIHGFVAHTFILPDAWQTAKLDLHGLSFMNRFELAINKFRQNLLVRYRDLHLQDQDYAIVAAMTLGDKTMLSNQTKDNYSIVGASHLLAVSGLHLGIIYVILSFLFDGKKLRLWGQGVILVAVWAYVALTGMSPSVMRAATMITVYSISSILNRDRFSLNTLAATAVLLLVSNPLSLWDVSFQMSFLAMLGIFTFYKPIYAIIPKKYIFSSSFLSFFWGLIVVSISAQIMTVPIVAYYFGRFSCYSILTNLIAIPAATFILYAAVGMFVLAPVTPLQSWVAHAMAVVADYLNHLLMYISRIPGASIEGINIDILHVILLYCLIACLVVVVYRFSSRKKVRIND